MCCFVRMAACESRRSLARLRLISTLCGVVTYNLFDMSYEGDPNGVFGSISCTATFQIVKEFLEIENAVEIKKPLGLLGETKSGWGRRVSKFIWGKATYIYDAPVTAMETLWRPYVWSPLNSNLIGSESKLCMIYTAKRIEGWKNLYKTVYKFCQSCSNFRVVERLRAWLL